MQLDRSFSKTRQSERVPSIVFMSGELSLTEELEGGLRNGTALRFDLAGKKDCMQGSEENTNLRIEK
jgi:hypothetical protein